MSKYDDKFRAGAVVTLQAAGYPEKPGALMMVAKQLKVPHTTLRRWFTGEQNPPPNETVQEKKLDLREQIRNEIDGIFDEMGRARQDATYRDLGTVAGILLDKLQLLDGDPTERNETTIRFVDDTDN